MLSSFEIINKNGSKLSYKPLKCEIQFTFDEKTWEFNNAQKPMVKINVNGKSKTILFTDAKKYNNRKL